MSMKKKWLSCFAIGFVACFAFGAVGCGEDQTGGNTVNEEQAFTAVQNAFAATKAYTGSFTFTGTTVTDFYGSIREGGMTYSYDTQTGVSYRRTWGENGNDGTTETVNRITAYNGGYAMQSYDSESDAKTDTYIMDEVEYTAFINTPCLDYVAMNTPDAFFWLNSDFSTVKTAFSEVTALIQAKLREQGKGGSFSRSVSAKTENGQYVFIVQQSMKNTNSVANASVKIYAQDGKIVKIIDEQSTENKMGNATMYRGVTNEMIIDYRFDQAGYDALATKLDTVSTPRVKEDGEYLAGHDVALVVNGEKLYDAHASIYMGDSLERVMNKLFDNSVISSLNIQGWYLDEACTQAFNPTTWKQLLSVDTLYTNNATVKENRTLIFCRFTTECVFSEETLYRIVGGYANYESDWICSVREYSGSYDFAQNGNYEDADKIIVNYEQTTASALDYQLGYVYFVEYVQVITDADMINNIIDMFD